MESFNVAKAPTPSLTIFDAADHLLHITGLQPPFRLYRLLLTLNIYHGDL
jgi:hypothetical protein